MNVRSITFFVHLDPRQPDLDSLAEYVVAFKEALSRADYTVQTVRLVLPPWPDVTNEDPALGLELAQKLDEEAPPRGIEYTSLGPVVCRERRHLEMLGHLPAWLAATRTIFLSADYSSKELGAWPDAALAIADVVRANAQVEPGGFANLRLAALVNVPSGVPFFPAAYAPFTQWPAVALALEAGPLAVEAFQEATTLADATRRLSQRVEQEALGLLKVMRAVCEAHHLSFLGFDFSLAPFPRPEQSTAAAVEAVGPAPFGVSGTLAVAAALTEALRQARYPRCGFNGLMLPVLEDAVLAARAKERTYTVHELLLYSAVCGTGLDTVPLPGDVDRLTLASLLLDVAALALRLDKPLAARLMPIPGKRAGDPVTFDFLYFADSVVLDVRGPTRADSALFGGEWMPYRP